MEGYVAMSAALSRILTCLSFGFAYPLEYPQRVPGLGPLKYNTEESKPTVIYQNLCDCH